MSDNIIEIRNVTKTYGAKDAVKNASLNIKRGEFVTLLGPSGCGKTTTLRMIAGFEMPTSGQIIFDGEDITNLPPHLRRVNTVFQKYALFPHLNVFNNIAFGLKMKLIPNGTKRNRKGEEVQLYRKTLRTTVTEESPLFRADSSRESPSRAPSSTSLKCCSWTNLSARWTSKCARTCSWNSWTCTAVSASPSSTSPTIRRRHSP